MEKKDEEEAIALRKEGGRDCLALAVHEKRSEEARTVDKTKGAVAMMSELALMSRKKGIQSYQSDESCVLTFFWFCLHGCATKCHSCTAASHSCYTIQCHCNRHHFQQLRVCEER